MRILPQPASANERALGQVYWEQFTGLTTDAITLAYDVATTQDGRALVQVFKNGALLSQGAGASEYSVTGSSITLGTAAIAGDDFVVWYHYRV